MARYFFHVFGPENVFDTIGSEFSTAQAVRNYMVLKAIELMGDDWRKPYAWDMEAIDETGKIVCTLEFGITLDETDIAADQSVEKQ